MSSPRDEREPAPAPFSADKELDELRRKFQSVEKSRDRFASRTAKLQADLDEARAQVAWFHRQLFGQKAERISKTEIEAAFRKFLDEQEARARGDAGPPGQPALVRHDARPCATVIRLNDVPFDINPDAPVRLSHPRAKEERDAPVVWTIAVIKDAGTTVEA